jgi:hypothetical protein
MSLKHMPGLGYLFYKAHCTTQPFYRRFGTVDGNDQVVVDG